VVATSNVTRISISLIAAGAAWRDPELWALERGLHEWVTGLEIPVARWDLLYHNAWTIEATALFALILISRSRTTTLAFLLSLTDMAALDTEMRLHDSEVSSLADDTRTPS